MQVPIIIVTKYLEDELDALDETDPDAVDAAEVLLEELYDNRHLLGKLHSPNSYPLHTPAFEIKYFEIAFQAGYRIYVLKFKDLNNRLPPYRIFLGYNTEADRYYALAITHRQHCYAPTHPAYGDLLNRYEQCRIPCIP